MFRCFIHFIILFIIQNINLIKQRKEKEYFVNLYWTRKNLNIYFSNEKHVKLILIYFQLLRNTSVISQKFDQKIQNIIRKQKTKIMQNILKQETILKNFQDFFIGIRHSKLTGFHTNLIEKTKQNINEIDFEEAKNILLKIHEKQGCKNKKNWKRDQVALFLYIVDKCQFGNQIWDSIASMIPGRNGQCCKIKILSLVPTNLNETPWTQIQQQILADIIEEEGVMKWKTVSLKLYERNPIKVYRSSKQCRQRYMCFLKPDLKKGFWTDEQDYQLIKLFLKYGRKWSKMAQHIKGRNENAIKNRFFLLFQQSPNNQKLYNSQLIRKVMRRKQRLQKILEIDHVIENQNNEGPTQTMQISNRENIENIKSEVSSTERQYKPQELAEIEKFFAF